MSCENTDPAEKGMMSSNYRAKLREARCRLGWSEQEAATRTGLSLPNYYDLEAYEGELACCYSLNEILRICRAFEMRPTDLIADGTGTLPAPVSIETVMKRIQEHCAERKLSISEFEDAAGWRLEPWLAKPRAALDAWNLDCLKDVCRELQINWAVVVASL